MMTEASEQSRPRKRSEDKASPERMCAACRTEGDREVLLHFVRAPDGRLAFDVRRKMPGRGINVCSKLSCVSKLRPGLPGIQALGGVKPLDAQFFADLLAALERDVLDQLGLLMRQKMLVVGADPTVDALASQKVHIVFLASDVAERTKRDVKDAIHRALDAAAWAKTEKLVGDHAWQRNSNVRNPLLVILPTVMQGLGHALGRDVVGVVGLGEQGFAQGKKGERAMRALVSRAALSKELSDREELLRDRVADNGEAENG
jgi:hypothetical protein